jgi:hypothetical protein
MGFASPITIAKGDTLDYDRMVEDNCDMFQLWKAHPFAFWFVVFFGTVCNPYTSVSLSKEKSDIMIRKMFADQGEDYDKIMEMGAGEAEARLRNRETTFKRNHPVRWFIRRFRYDLGSFFHCNIWRVRQAITTVVLRFYGIDVYALRRYENEESS